MVLRREEVEREPSLNVILGTNVHALRVLRLPKMTQADLAARAHVSLETVRQIEVARDPARQGVNIQIDTLARIADALGVEASTLLSWDSPTRVFRNPRSETPRSAA